MKCISPLYIVISAALFVLGTQATPSDKPVAIEDPCNCPQECEPHHTVPSDNVKIYKSTEYKKKIFCFSLQPIRWTLGSNSKKIPRLDPNELRLQSSSTQDSNKQVYCLSLKVIPPYPSWQAPTLFAKCETYSTSERSSRWYKLRENWEFEGQYFGFKPLVKLNPKNSSNDESVKPTEEPSNNYTTSFKMFDNITVDFSSTPTQHSIADFSHSVPLTIVIAAAGGATVFFVSLLILVAFLLKKVKQQRKQIELTKEEIDEFLLGIPRHKANANGINDLFVLPYDTRLEISKDDVTFCSTILGSGAFGHVVKGKYQGNLVAIKMLKNNASQNADYLRSLLGELKVMSYLGSHPNLVALVGAITSNVKNGEAYLIFEYCSHGNAQKFVRSHRDNFVDLLAVPAPSQNISLTRTTSLTTKDLVRWAYEVASGMEAVSSKNVYHGDLAARNILLTEDLTAKVGDFGLSKQLDMEKYSCYVKQTQCPLPVKWMAIESLRNLTFSIQSDVWSFGVTLWEFFTLGATPYPGMDWNFESWKLLSEGKRLDRPEYASEAVYVIMRSCWDADPMARPSFAQLKDLLAEELHKF